MNTVIIEDEPQVTASLTLLIGRYCPFISIVGTADSFEEGYNLCKLTKPDLLLCDIRLNSVEGTGMDLVQMLDTPAPKVIFITGLKEYAIDAFRVNAVDYLLKPVTIKELTRALDKARGQAGQSDTDLKQSKGSLRIPSPHGFLLVPFSDLIRCEAQNAYTHFYITDHSIRKTAAINLGTIIDKLPGEWFFRVHKTHVVNKAHIVEFKRNDGGVIRMSDNAEVPLSRFAKEAFMKWL